MLEMRASGRDRVEDYADKFDSAVFVAGKKPWEVADVDIVMPCATQNEVNFDDAHNQGSLR
jgi:glutamate dehydrogenase (NADP+)